MTVVIPTLHAGPDLAECLRALFHQTYPSFRVVVVDNSGTKSVRALGLSHPSLFILENQRNAGFGEAINQGFRAYPAPLLAALNDDAIPSELWLESLVRALLSNPDFGMAASRILLRGEGLLDSTGLRIARDGSSKQEGHLHADPGPGLYREALIPSGCAALYRGEMLLQIGLFAADYFLYCEDTDLALRGLWAGWRCVYVPEAVVDHAYSASAGRASWHKAYYVERNRLRTVIRNFPLSWLILVPLYSAARYLWHALALLQGRGKAGQFRGEGGSAWRLPWAILRAHLEALLSLPQLLRQRIEIKKTRRISRHLFAAYLRRFGVGVREVAYH